MATKQTPGQFDCYANALPDEPMFVLLARDPDFRRLVQKWAKRRRRDCAAGLRPMSDMKMVQAALDTALAGEMWRRANDGKWRTP